MTPAYRFRLIIAAALLAGAQSAHSTQPTDSVTSDGYDNTAMGTNALQSLTSGIYSNTAAGAYALTSNSQGSYNTAFGAFALNQNTSGAGNTATGISALYLNSTGSGNTATGQVALQANTTGSNNTTVGAFSLYQNTTGSANTAVGYSAMLANAGAYNTATGYQALYSGSNATGENNTAYGANALYSNTTGKGNAAQGVNALYSNTTGIRNLGIGSNALYGNVTGSNSVALGFDAGYNANGNDNIYINNMGLAEDSQTLRLGTQGTSGVVGSGILTAYIAGVANSTVTGAAVYINPATGQLGVLASSERFKTEVEPMGAASEEMAALRPVTFKLKNDPAGTRQYGLIAEEVAKVYPELVIRGAEGRIDGVRYEELAPMLLNEVQQQQHSIAAQGREIKELKRANESIRAEMAKLLAKDH